ncbi:MAG: pyruvate ferredoxin oxidoreductase [Dehalococcoidia bacterium]|nr:MAG: pyruvate ferredoxin oxidoreductase [Dehalococcoidia bacterium]TEU16049.1 MAG: pyruvate ferredoxin oxidoreductase [Dehalococcoidia bacterium]
MGTRECQHICGESSPAVGEAGKTGEWRDSFPVIDQEKCLPVRQNKPSCFLCWLYCPEAIISKTIPIQINMDYCKGCGICAQLCPAHAITMVHEEEFCLTETD